MGKFFESIYTILLLITIPLSTIFGAFESYPNSAFNAGMGNLSLNIKGNLFASINEPSSLIAFGTTGGEASWSRPFQIRELQQIAFAGGTRYNDWGIGFGISSFGNKIYNENIYTASIARAFKEKLKLGISVHLYQLHIDAYGNDQSVGLTTSVRYSINKNWIWVSSIRNLNSPKIGAIEENLPQIFTTGFSGNLNEMITIAAEWEQDIEYEGALKFGIAVKPIERLLLAVGYVSNPGQFTAGLSLTINNLYIEYGTIAYNDLGLFTHQFSIGFSVKRY